MISLIAQVLGIATAVIVWRLVTIEARYTNRMHVEERSRRHAEKFLKYEWARPSVIENASLALLTQRTAGMMSNRQLRAGARKMRDRELARQRKAGQ